MPAFTERTAFHYHLPTWFGRWKVCWKDASGYEIRVATFYNELSARQYTNWLNGWKD